MDLPPPEPGPGELLVRVGAAGVNPFDGKVADGYFDGVRPHRFPLILGVDGAGRVESVGPGVVEYRPGDRVYGQFLHSPVGTGTYCELTTVPERIGIDRIPSGVEAVAAAAIPTAGMTARVSLDQLALRRGETLLVLGAAGGVGTIAVQLAVADGVRVFAGSRPEHFEFLRRIGASECFDTAAPDLVPLVRRALPEGVHGLLDVMHPSADLGRLLPVLRPGAAVASTIGAAGDDVARPAGVRGINIDMQPSHALLGRLSDALARGVLKAPVEARLPLERGPEAIAQLRAGRGKGKTVLLP